MSAHDEIRATILSMKISVDLSVIIVNWNSAEYLKACLKSLYQLTQGISYEVIVVDNASEDGCGTMLQKDFPEVRFIQSMVNLGFAGANNLGSSKARGGCLLFLNPDTEVIDDAIVRMLRHLHSAPLVGAVGARLLNTDGSLQTSCVQAFPTISNQFLDSDLMRRIFPRWRGWGMQALYAGRKTGVEVEAISGACFMVKRDVFEKVGLFGTQYFMYSDDLDLSYKIYQAGYAIHYLGDCEIIHHGGKSSSQQDSDFSSLWQKESMLAFFRATKGSLYCASYRAALAVVAVLRMAVVSLLSVLGQHTIEGKPSTSVLRKWSKILGWSVGLSANYRTMQKTPSAL